MGVFWAVKFILKMEREQAERFVHRRRRHMASKLKRLRLDQRVEQLESDLGRTLLFGMAMNRVLVRKGLLTPSEIAKVAREVDHRDGEEDPQSAELAPDKQSI